MKAWLSVLAGAFLFVSGAYGADPVLVTEATAAAVETATENPSEADCAAARLSAPAWLETAAGFPGSSNYCGRCSQHLCRGEDVGAVCDTGRTCVVSAGVCSIGGMTCSCV